jgi:hypothetical protein
MTVIVEMNSPTQTAQITLSFIFLPSNPEAILLTVRFGVYGNKKAVSNDAAAVGNCRPKFGHFEIK